MADTHVTNAGVGGDDRVPDDRVPAVTHRLDVDIEGMSCAACAARIQGSLEGLDGVSSANVNFATGRATLETDAAIGIDVVRSTVESLGYEVPPSRRPRAGQPAQRSGRRA